MKEMIEDDAHDLTVNIAEFMGMPPEAFHHLVKNAFEEFARKQSSAPQWQPIETAPEGFDGKRFHYVLFRGTSKGNSFQGYAHVSGWMDSNRKPVHNYSYVLNIIDWMPLPEPPQSEPPK